LFPNSRIAVLRSGLSAREEQLPRGVDELFYNEEEALRFKPDAAIIATPSNRHVPVAQILVEGGAHVLIEKPISNTRDGVEGLISAAKARQKVLMVGYNLIFAPSIRAMKAAVESGRVGRVFAIRAEVGQYLPDWRPGTDYRRGASARGELGGGALLELSHEIHYMLWMFGPVKSVQATVINSGILDIDVEDLALLNIVFSSGAAGTLQLDFLRKPYSRTCCIMGTNGTINWSATENSVAFVRPEGLPAESIFREEATDRNLSYMEELRHFFSCIENGASPLIPGEAALSVLDIVLAAKRSAMTGQTVSL